ncbi:ATP synthase subunit I [Volucribacter amazonae]|uniref:ATP synthase protein I n=1 Tax=Volucribacter amazonae TaxID=256731 RepID=A0A9X4PPI0_9PAST|nr:ATP synthase subunit I [Volucribacter amazonae]MDG6895268.1 hypothetical protein [Volucribacter amazonae]
MSRILGNTRALYVKVILIEAILLAVFSLLLAIYQQHYGVSFLFGAISSFIPQVLLIGFVFFREKSQYLTNKTTALYQGEGIKFLLTMFMIALVFIFYQAINLVIFFIAFVFFLALNVVLPMILLIKQQKNRIS